MRRIAWLFGLSVALLLVLAAVAWLMVSTAATATP